MINTSALIIFLTLIFSISCVEQKQTFASYGNQTNVSLVDKEVQDAKTAKRLLDNMFDFLKPENNDSRTIVTMLDKENCYGTDVFLEDIRAYTETIIPVWIIRNNHEGNYANVLEYWCYDKCRKDLFLENKSRAGANIVIAFCGDGANDMLSVKLSGGVSPRVYYFRSRDHARFVYLGGDPVLVD